MESGLWKAVHVLAGSIIEAVLIDYLLATNYQKMTQTAILKMELGDVITACKTEGILSERAAHLSDVIRSYRNLIHPGRVIRLQEIVDAEGAKIAQALVGIVIREITSARKEKYGYTAEQIAEKLKSDPAVIAILPHLLRDMREIEIRRLLLAVLPQAYFDLEELSETETRSFRECFRLAYNNAPDELKIDVAKHFVTILKEESQYRITIYEEAFFVASDLKYYTPEDTNLVKEHLFALLQRENRLHYPDMLSGLGKFLSARDIIKFTNLLINKTIRYEGMSKEIHTYVNQLSSDTTEKVREKMIEIIDTHIEYSKEQVVISKALSALREALDNVIPF